MLSTEERDEDYNDNGSENGSQRERERESTGARTGVNDTQQVYVHIKSIGSHNEGSTSAGKREQGVHVTASLLVTGTK